MSCYLYNTLMECIFDATLKYTSHGNGIAELQHQQHHQAKHPSIQSTNICSQMPIAMKCLHLSLFSFGIWNCFYLCCCTGDHRWSWMENKKICCMGNQLHEMPFCTENTLHLVINFSVNMPGGTLSSTFYTIYNIVQCNVLHLIRDAFCFLFNELSSSWWWFTMGMAVNCFRFVWWFHFNIWDAMRCDAMFCAK